MRRKYYQSDQEVLKFSVLKNEDEILFNHYLTQKENLQRIKKELPRGQFYLTISSVEKDLNIPRGKARGLIKKFEKIGVITNVYKPPRGKKVPSIYAYNAVFSNTDNNTDSNTDSNSDEHSKTKVFSSVGDTDDNTDNNTDSNTSKKEYLKRISKNISSSTTTKKSYIDFFESNFHMPSSHEIGILSSFLDDGMSEDLIIMAMERAVENNVRNIKYVKTILQKWLENNITTPEAVKAEQLEFERNKTIPKEVEHGNTHLSEETII